jgi:hypothetical protein
MTTDEQTFCAAGVPHLVATVDICRLTVGQSKLQRALRSELPLVPAVC